MNYSMIRCVLGYVIMFVGAFLLLPALVALIYSEQVGVIYLIIGLVSIILGFIIVKIKKLESTAMFSKEGFVIVSLSWIILSLIGAVPMYLTGEIPHYIDALFETVSGFTTTGASILSDVESLSMATKFWRTFTHWVGGMGVLVFIMAILPLSGGRSVFMMKAESPGPSVEKLAPRVRQTAKILYGIYIAITAAEVISLLITGLNLFESLTLTFATLGTGGFGLLNSSIGSYSMATQIVITVFMILSSINFGCYYLIIMKKAGKAFKNEELRVYLCIILVSAVVIAINIMDGISNFGKAFQTSIFQVASIISTTGFSTADTNQWPALSKTILLILMFIGACAGSTGGGLKISRLIIILKSIKKRIMESVHPRSVQAIRINGKKNKEEVSNSVLGYFGLYMLIVFISFLIVSADGYDFETNFSAVAATFNNIGPGFGMVGATGNYSEFSVLSKIVLILDMLIGRLEIYPVILLFVPELWKRGKKGNFKKRGKPQVEEGKSAQAKIHYGLYD